MKEIKDLGFGVIQVNETKPTISKMESVDNYRDMWQILKEFISNRSTCAGYVVQVRLIWDILDKMQELEQGEKDEKDC